MRSPAFEARQGGFTLRTGRADDAGAIADIERQAFDSDRLSPRSLRRFLTVATTETVVASAGPVLVGYAMIGFRRTSGMGRVFSLAVVRRAARQGLGRALLTGCEAEAWRRGCHAVRLEVRDDNHAAIALYERAGYAVVGRHADYYEDGSAALCFQKNRAAPA